jgi:hypothetical protein
MNDYAGWMPVRINRTPSGLKLEWRCFGDLRFTDPFFEQTAGRCAGQPNQPARQRETPIEALGELADRSPSLAPTGFIFHMSRCGSTLISQMLAVRSENVVISEADPIDGVLCAPLRDPKITADQQVMWLRLLLKVFGQRRFAGEKHLFVKFDCWHTLCLPLVQRAFPEVPWVFLYREPVEVLVSHRRQIGGQMVPGKLEPAFFGWDSQAVSRMSPSEYGGRVLGKICEAALAQARAGHGKLVHYRQLPAVVWSELLKYWGVPAAPDVVEAMTRVARFHAKTPALPFEDDRRSKNREATEDIRQVARQWLDGTYQQLEACRKSQGL